MAGLPRKCPCIFGKKLVILPLRMAFRLLQDRFLVCYWDGSQSLPVPHRLLHAYVELKSRRSRRERRRHPLLYTDVRQVGVLLRQDPKPSSTDEVMPGCPNLVRGHPPPRLRSKLSSALSFS
jgi:hypothetical protein